MAFDGGLAFLIRLAEPYARTARRQLLIAPLVGAATIILGVLAFIPFHIFKRLGVPDAVLVAVLFASCALVFTLARRAPVRVAGDRWLLLVPWLFQSFLLLVLVTHHVEPASALVVAVATLFTLCYFTFACRRGAVSAGERDDVRRAATRS
jgi:hypothetical protein